MKEPDSRVSRLPELLHPLVGYPEELRGVTHRDAHPLELMYRGTQFQLRLLFRPSGILGERLPGK